MLSSPTWSLWSRLCRRADGCLTSLVYTFILTESGRSDECLHCRLPDKLIQIFSAVGKQFHPTLERNLIYSIHMQHVQYFKPINQNSAVNYKNWVCVFVGLKLCSAVILQLIKYAQFLFFVSPLTFPYCNIYHCLLPSGHVFTHLLFFSLFFFNASNISKQTCQLGYITGSDIVFGSPKKAAGFFRLCCAVGSDESTRRH